MTLRRVSRVLPLIIFACVISMVARTAMAQSNDETASQATKDQTNLDTQLYLLVGSNQENDSARLPAVLEPVVKQLRSTLQFKNYRLAATLINRVRNGGRLSLRWIGEPLALGTTSPNIPSFSEFKVSAIRLVTDQRGQQAVQMENFSFGARIPIQTSGPVASNSQVPPVFNYENTGLNTDISMREGEPVVVGTLNIGSSGDAIILVVSAKRTMQ